MKKFLASLFILFACALCVSFAACGGKSDKVTISFEANGGTEVAAVELDNGAEYDLPETTKSDYEFEGWFDNPGLTGEAVTHITASESVTYYAKWAKLYNVTLDADGGNLPSGLSTSFKLKVGGSLYEALKPYVPRKTDDYQFDAWLNGASAVTLNTKMPNGDVSLKARYKVKYVLEVYRQNIEGDDFVKDEEDIIGYGLAGSFVAPEPDTNSMKGFSIDSGHEGSNLSGTLSATVSENVFSVYLARESYTVTFHANYPDGTDSEVAEYTVKYGVSVVLPDNLDYIGYRLVGWAYSSGGATVYSVDSITGRLFNGDGSDYEQATFLPDMNMGLYAVWERGYYDMFGGSDSVFVFGTGNAAYLNRDGVCFEGKYDAAENTVEFTVGSEKLVCKLFADGTFAYCNEDRHTEYALYTLEADDDVIAPVIDGDTLLSFDGYNGVTYTVKKSGSDDEVSKGTFAIDGERGYYTCAFTSGTLSGETLTVILSQTMTADGMKYVFRVRDEKEFELGALCRGLFMGGILTYQDAPVNNLVLTGFHSAMLVGAEGYTMYLCLADGEDGLALYTVSPEGKGELAFNAKIVEIDGQDCYLIYSKEYDIEATSGSEVLTIDGCVNATYKGADGQTVSGYFSMTDTAFGEALVTLFVEGNEYADFILTRSSQNYTFEKKHIGHAEFNYSEGSYIYENIYLVLNDGEEDGTAAIYYRTAEGTLTKVSSGTFTQDGNTYIYTKTDWTAPEQAVLPFPDDFDSFVFTLTTKSSAGNSYFVNIWTKYSKGGEDTELYKKKYQTADGRETLALLQADGVAVYSYPEKDNTITLVCNYRLIDFTSAIELAVGVDYYIYFGLDETHNQFFTIEEPYKIYMVTPDFNRDENKWLVCTGSKSGSGLEAIYYVKDGSEETPTKGVISTNLVTREYTFTPDSEGAVKAFKYMVFTDTSSGESFASVYNEQYAGMYTSEEYGILELDGYGSAATLNDVTASYIVQSENVVVIRSATNIYIDIVVEGGVKSFKQRDVAYGTYLFYNNGNVNGMYFEFDGYGGLKVYKRVQSGGSSEKQYLDEDGEYELTDGGASVSYTAGDLEITGRAGKFGTVVIGGTAYRAFSFTYDSIRETKYDGRYVDTSDWSVIELSGSGTATKYFPDGAAVGGTYEIITDSLFYMVAADGSFAGVYAYDKDNGTVTPVNNQARRYFTSDMQELLLTSHGFAIVNGTTRCYYVTEGSKIYLYSFDENGNAQANDYGFVKTELREESANTVNYNEKSYTLGATGQLTFTRDGDSAKYPVKAEGTSAAAQVTQIAFTPADNAVSYTADGKITIGEQEYDCTVTSYTDSEGAFTYYIIYGNYRLAVNLTYDGSSYKFTVTSLDEVQTVYSQLFIANYRLTDMFAGSGVSNDWGVIQIFTSYGDNGDKTENLHVSASLGAYSGLYDTKGSLLAVNYQTCTLSGSGVYTVAFEGADGCGYEMAFTVSHSDELGVDGYAINYVTRTQTIVAGELSLEAHVLISSDVLNAAAGTLYSAKLTKGEEINCDFIIEKDGGVYLVSRTVAEGKITATKYYSVTLKTKEFTADEILAGLDGIVVPLYESAEVEELSNVSTYYTADGNAYADIDTVNHKVLAVFVKDGEEFTGYGVTANSYVSESYEISLTSKQAYALKVEADKITLAKIAEVID